MTDRPNDHTKPEDHPDAEGAELDGDDARVAETGNAYVGRTMDDDLKTNPRETEPGAGVDETPDDASTD